MIAAAIKNIYLGWFYSHVSAYFDTRDQCNDTCFAALFNWPVYYIGVLLLRWARFYKMVVKVNGNMAAWLCVFKLALKQCYT